MYANRIVRWILPALLLSPVFTVASAIAGAQISITVTTAPPVLPVYEQPPCPEDGYMWVPGYWAWGDEDGYYWVPGEWVPAPYTGALWTPPWWGWDNGRYRFHEGYWGDDVGYYGGIDYGHGYMGEGFVGGEWRNGRFAYNTAVMRVNRRVVRNVYVNQTIVRERTISNNRRIAYNGGPGGIRHEPTPIERRGMSGRHTALTPVQQQRIQAARADRDSYAKANNGRPRTVVVTRPAGAVRNEGPANRNESGRRQPERGGIAPAPVRPEARPVPSRNRPESRTEPDRRPESRRAPVDSPRNESRPVAPQERRPMPESRPMPDRRYEQRPAPDRETQRTGPRPNAPAERPRTEPRPQTERPRTESRPASPEREQRPARAPREQRAAPAPHAEPQHPQRPAEPHASVSRPAPQREARSVENRPSAAHSNPRADGGEKQGKPHSD
jgi:hypothetical protein